MGEARPRHVCHYLAADGADPFAKWLESVKRLPALARVLVRLDRAEDGNLGDHAAVGEGVWELRLDFGPGYRVYYGEDGDDLVLLTGGTKATQARDISTAKRYWRDYNA